MACSKLKSLFLVAGVLISSVAAAPPSAGCGKDLPPNQTPGGQSQPVNFTQSHGSNRDRTYLIHIPSNYDKTVAVPLIFSFHGNGQNSTQQEELSQFSNEYFNPNAIAVYPQGVNSSWEGAPYAVAGVDDIGFVQDMINQFNDLYCVEPTKYYAAGKSNGGGFCGTLACDASLSKQIAAFAPVSGAFYVPGSTEADCTKGGSTSIPLTCKAGRTPIPVIEFHGSADKTIPYAGRGQNGECLPSIPHWVREWSLRDGFGLSNVTTQLNDSHVQKYEYGNGSNFGTVTHYLTDGLKHAWPSTNPNEDNSKGTYYNATTYIMEFFGKYTL